LINNPYFNLAAEEYLLKELDCSENDYAYIYINNPAVVVGRNQNIYEEVDLKYCKSENIDICRRISGGGTVYHDLGNINIAFFSSSQMNKVNSYSYFMQYLFEFLKLKGLDAYLNERNSIYIGDKKIGGNAQFTNKNNILSHCTLLFKSDLEKLEKSIGSPFNKIESKASKSVRSSVINISELINVNSINKFINELSIFFQGNNRYRVVKLNEQSIKIINDIYISKFESFNWIYARSPRCKITHNDGIFEIENGIINSSTITKFENLPFLPQGQLLKYF
jgi:lipoate-protein ligase A